MAKEDEILTRYFSDDERYADLINGVSFGGRQVVRPEDLSERDTKTGYHANTKAIKGKKNIKYRDLFRKASFGANFVVIGVENQKQVHYLMPLRCMEYDLKEYQRQEASQKRDFEKTAGLGTHVTDAEFLSGVFKESKLHPCITIVLYYGDEWDGSYDLHGLLNFENIPEELRGMVNNYKLNMLNIKQLEQTNIFHTDLKQVCDFIRYAKDKEKLKWLIENDPAYKTMREDAYEVIAAFTKSKELVQIKEKYTEEEKNMCQALREWAEEERNEGKTEGKIEGKIEGRLEEKVENLRAIMKNLQLTVEKAMDVLEVPQEERAQYMAKI